MSLTLRQRQDLGLGSAKRVVQFPNVGQPEAVKGRPQLRFGQRLVSQENDLVIEVAVERLQDEKRIIHDG